MPDICYPIWQMFLQLHKTRGHTGYSYLPISYQELDAYARVHRRSFTPEELYLLCAADDAALEQLAANAKNEAAIQ